MSRLRTLLAMLAGCLLLTACVSMPTAGPVVEADVEAHDSPVLGIAIDPRPPEPGASATEIVQGFLAAMQATPIQTTVASQFLAEDVRASWNPGLATVTYVDRSPPRGRGTVNVGLSEVSTLDARGAFLGTVPEQTLSFPMLRERGEWRIAQAPDALVVPASWFENRFTQVSLYFFDQAGRILVPEPVFVPRGSQLATSLVRGLVRGPGEALSGVVRSFLPAGVHEGLSVPVSEDGVAEISLTGEVAEPSPEAIYLMTAQLAWTLRQDQSIQGVRLSIGGRPVQLPRSRAVIGVDDSPEFDPGGYQPSRRLFGVADGDVVTGSPGALTTLPDLFGPAVRSVAVDLGAQTAAAVTEGGGTLLVSPLSATEAPAAYSGTDLLRPAWDFADRLWVVDRTPQGAAVSYVSGDRRRPVDVPGLTGADVRQFLVSRDGTRLVAVVRGPEGDSIAVSRIRSDDQGRVVGATPAVTVGGSRLGAMRISDIGWHTPTTVAVLHQLADTAQIRTVSLDGAGFGFPELSVTIGSRVTGLVSSPVAGDPIWALGGQQLFGLAGEARDTSIPDPVDSLSYVG